MTTSTPVLEDTTANTVPAAPPRTRRQRWRADRVSMFAVFLGLPMILYVVLVVSPFVQSMYYSLTDWSGFSPEMNFIGLDNFVRLFTQERLFLIALRNNVVLLLVLPITTIVIALALATLVTVGGTTRGQVRGIRNAGLYRVVSFFPHVMPAIVVGIIWSQVYDPNAGLLNGVLQGIGLRGFDGFAWLGEPATAMGATIFVILWGLIGFYMVLFIAAIRGIDVELFDAMRVDGANRIQTAIHLTIPMIKGSLRTAYVYLSIIALESFTFMQALNPLGGPDNATIVMAQVLFRTAFSDGQFGLATAMGVVLAAVTMLFALAVFGINRLTGSEED
ncbi:carbohydrate ABC transporter permease [Propionibacteriaceae bacterium Y1700]|uniref:carbohydrate ABC transporter permease n=1 Tax=Microlunatus sp. Y1700 TaxID=3418487 RepID=UPI003DA72A4A